MGKGLILKAKASPNHEQRTPSEGGFRVKAVNLGAGFLNGTNKKGWFMMGFSACARDKIPALNPASRGTATRLATNASAFRGNTTRLATSALAFRGGASWLATGVGGEQTAVTLRFMSSRKSHARDSHAFVSSRKSEARDHHAFVSSRKPQYRELGPFMSSRKPSFSTQTP